MVEIFIDWTFRILLNSFSTVYFLNLRDLLSSFLNKVAWYVYFFECTEKLLVTYLEGRKYLECQKFYKFYFPFYFPKFLSSIFRRLMRHNLFYSLFVYRLIDAALKGFFSGIHSHFKIKSLVICIVYSNFVSRCTERKNWVIWPKKLGQILVPLVTQLLRTKYLNFFLSVHWEKKLSHFDLKSRVAWIELRQKHLIKKTFKLVIYCIRYPTGNGQSSSIYKTPQFNLM